MVARLLLVAGENFNEVHNFFSPGFRTAAEEVYVGTHGRNKKCTHRRSENVKKETAFKV
jgi:hypothetical protein